MTNFLAQSEADSMNNFHMNQSLVKINVPKDFTRYIRSSSMIYICTIDLKGALNPNTAKSQDQHGALFSCRLDALSRILWMHISSTNFRPVDACSRTGTGPPGGKYVNRSLFSDKRFHPFAHACVCVRLCVCVANIKTLILHLDFLYQNHQFQSNVTAD